MSGLHLLFLLFLTTTLFAQEPEDKIHTDNLNVKYLEHLIKIKIDSVRQVYDCKPLVNDSILYIAAQHHANYMTSLGRLTHNEEEYVKTRTPQLRAEFYGAVDYLVGENVLKTQANTLVKSKKNKVFNTSTYGGLADNIVYGWVNSPGHFKNIITPDYQITGLAITHKGGKIFACQKFAQVMYKFTFEESPTLFQYSDYEPEPVINSFAGISSELIPKYKYEWGLRHNEQEKCETCNLLTTTPPLITLRYEKGNFILRIENSEYVQALIEDKKDGFAVEIVEYNDYACGNPEYYTKPSRRNGQLKTNGILVEPLFRDDLRKGYKKRKKKKDMAFLPYLFGADSVKFKNRFSQYKTAQYSSEYFEIKLGKLPRGTSGLWAHNLIYIQENEICHVDYFTGYCGGLFMDTVAFDFMPADTHALPVDFKDQKKKEFFEIPFEQNKFTFTADDIAPFIASLKNVNYIVDSVHIKASASVEGDSITNEALMRKRAAGILAVWQSNQLEPIKASIETEIAWQHFYSAVRLHPRHQKLAQADHTTIINALKDDKIRKDLESTLKAERKAAITLFVRVPASKHNQQFLIRETMQQFTQRLEKEELLDEVIDTNLDSISDLYAFAHQQTVAGALRPDFLASLELPSVYSRNKTLMEQYWLYGHEFSADFSKNEQWMKQKGAIRAKLAKLPTKSVSPVFWYNHAYFLTRGLLNSKKITQEKAQKILNILQPLRTFYYENAVARENIESLNFNLTMILLNTAFSVNPTASAESAKTALDQVAIYYAHHDTVDAERILNMAKMAVYYGNNDQAQRLASPYLEEADIIQYIVPLSYAHVSDPFSEMYYVYLLQLAETLSPEVWCTFFMTECGIPFQAFDHEALRNKYCEICK